MLKVFVLILIQSLIKPQGVFVVRQMKICKEPIPCILMYNDLVLLTLENYSMNAIRNLGSLIHSDRWVSPTTNLESKYSYIVNERKQRIMCLKSRHVLHKS